MESERDWKSDLTPVVARKRGPVGDVEMGYNLSFFILPH